MDVIEFNKMTEEIEEVANKYGLMIDFSKGTIGEETEITLKLCKKESNDHRICKTCKGCKYYLWTFEGFPCVNCCRNFKLIDEIREQQNDRWKEGTPNG